MNGIIKRLLLIGTVILLFLFTMIRIPLIINVIVMSGILILEIISRKIRFESMAFFITYSAMLVVNIVKPTMAVLPRMPFFIYPILAVMAILSLVIKQPFTNGFHFEKGELSIPASAWISSLIWTLAFILAGFFAYYFFPNHLYLLFSFGCIVMAVFLNVVYGRFTAS